MDAQERQIMWAWLLDNPSGEKEQGWSGVYGLPRSLWVGEDSMLRMAPVKELETLRRHEKPWNILMLADGETRFLEGVVGDAFELALEIESKSAQRCGLKVRASKRGEKETLLYYDAGLKQLVFDATRSGHEGRKVVERASFALNPGEPVKLRVFMDKSVVECHANERQAICRRVFPTRSDSLGVALFTHGGSMSVAKLQAWQIIPSNPY
jgi:beta-fructofuranosidase